MVRNKKQNHILTYPPIFGMLMKAIRIMLEKALLGILAPLHPRHLLVFIPCTSTRAGEKAQTPGLARLRDWS